MTVCVAAVCSANILFGASDRMLTAGDVQFEPESPKIYAISNSTVVMIAGESSLQIAILQHLYKYVRQQIDENPKQWISLNALANEYYRSYQIIKGMKAEERVLLPLGLTRATFLTQQAQMAPHIVTELTKELLNFEMAPIEAIIAGVDDDGAHIFVASNSGVACRDAIGFAAIGAGYWHANSQFMFAGHNRMRPLPETLLLTYAAKRRAEVAPGVGSGTDMFTLGAAPGTFTMLREEIVGELGEIYKRTRHRAAESVTLSNQEVTKYVEGLGKASAAQEQTTPAPRPAEKRDGKEHDEGTGSKGDETERPN